MSSYHIWDFLPFLEVFTIYGSVYDIWKCLLYYIDEKDLNLNYFLLVSFYGCLCSDDPTLLFLLHTLHVRCWARGPFCPVALPPSSRGFGPPGVTVAVS